MYSRKTFRTRVLGMTAAALVFAYPIAHVAHAQSSPPASRDAPAGATSTDPARGAPGAGMGSAAPVAPTVSAFELDKEHLQSILGGAKSRDDYARILEDDGYTIASVNDDKPELLEYEVVKADKTYEVRLRFDKDASVANKIDITGNMWKAKETKELLKQSKGDSAPMASGSTRPRDTPR